MQKRATGFSIIEIIIACAIFLSTIAAYVVSADVLREMSKRAEEKTQAALLLEEGAEAVWLLRDEDWGTNIDALTLGEPYSLYWDGDSYETSAEDVLIGGKYWRQVTFLAAYRSGTGTLAESGTEDENTRRVVIEILASSDGETLAASEMLVHNTNE